jgi:hypothetical protein
MKNFIYIIAGVLTLAITSCKKTVLKQISDAAVGTQLKFIHAAPGVPALDAFVNGIQITPTVNASVTDNAAPTSIITGYSYLGVFPASNYAVVASGNTSIKINSSTPTPSLVTRQTVTPGSTISSITQATTDGSAYSVFTIGLPGSATAGLTTKIVEDKFPDAVSGKAYIRLAYLIPNGTAVDLQGTYTPTGGTATTKTLITNVSYTSVTDFVAVDVNALSSTSYTFQLYLAGTVTKLGTVSAAISLTPGRYYTIIGRGLAADYVVPGTGITLKASTRPTLPTTDPATKFPEIYFNPAGITFYTNK